MNLTLIFEYLFFYGALFLSFIFISVYFYFKYAFTYWSRKGFPYIKPKFPLGNNNCIGLGALSYGIETLDWYKEIKKMGVKFGGAWSWSNPVLVVVDPSYVKDILVKDFNYFIDRDFYHNPESDTRNESLFVVEKEEWKNMRQHLSHTFTSAKMKMMFPGVAKCTEPLIHYLDRSARNKEYVDAKDVLAAYTIDVIGSNIFGLELEAFKSKDSKFRVIGREIFRADLMKGIQVILLRISEWAARKMGIQMIPKYITADFEKVVKDTIDYRIKNNVKRQDFMQLTIDLYESTKHQEKPFTFNHVVANAIGFFIAGFDTSANTMHYALYELAINQDIQERARKEINRVLKEHNGDLTYEAVQSMTYIKQILDETLRLYPPLSALARIAVKPYKLRDSNFVLEKGSRVVIPVIGFHKDPEYFSEPDRFDPERFSPENKKNIAPYVYMPFGEGPRLCLGMRFGTMQSSIGLIQILKNFKVTLSPSTPIPLTPKPGIFVMLPDKPIHIRVERL